MKTYHEKVFDEIVEIIKNNLELMYNFDDDALINIRNYCHNNAHHRYKPLEYNKLIFFTEETIAKIINAPYLYDFRLIE